MAPPTPTALPPPLLICGALFLALSAATLTPSIGGYGFITWSLHPLLTLAGLWLLLPPALLSASASPDAPPSPWLPSSYEGRRVLHGLLAACGVGALLCGWGVAWWSHHARGHAHIPGFHKPWAKQAHVWGGLIVLAVAGAQLAVGAARHYPSLRAGCPRRVLAAHGAAGLPLWVAAALVSCLGLWLPFGASSTAVPLVAAALIAASAAGAGVLVVALGGGAAAAAAAGAPASPPGGVCVGGSSGAVSD